MLHIMTLDVSVSLKRWSNGMHVEPDCHGPVLALDCFVFYAVEWIHRNQSVSMSIWKEEFPLICSKVWGIPRPDDSKSMRIHQTRLKARVMRTIYMPCQVRIL